MTAGLSDGSADQEYAWNAGDTGDPGSILRSGKSLGGGKWQSTPVLLTGKFHGQRSLAAYSPQGHKKSDMTEQIHSLYLTGLKGLSLE